MAIKVAPLPAGSGSWPAMVPSHSVAPAGCDIRGVSVYACWKHLEPPMLELASQPQEHRHDQVCLVSCRIGLKEQKGKKHRCWGHLCHDLTEIQRATLCTDDCEPTQHDWQRDCKPC
jgi:hypothetical protein